MVEIPSWLFWSVFVLAWLHVLVSFWVLWQWRREKSRADAFRRVVEKYEVIVDPGVPVGAPAGRSGASEPEYMTEASRPSVAGEDGKKLAEDMVDRQRELDKCRAELTSKEELLSAEIDRISAIRRNLVAAMEGTREQLNWLAGHLRLEPLKIDEPTADAAKRVVAAAAEKIRAATLESLPAPGPAIVAVKGLAETVLVRHDGRDVACLKWKPRLWEPLPAEFYHKASGSAGWAIHRTQPQVSGEWLKVFGDGELAVPLSVQAHSPELAEIAKLSSVADPLKVRAIEIEEALKAVRETAGVYLKAHDVAKIGAARNRLQRRVDGQLKQIHKLLKCIERLKQEVISAVAREGTQVSKFKAEADDWRAKYDEMQGRIGTERNTALGQLNAEKERLEKCGKEAKDPVKEAYFASMADAFLRAYQIVNRCIKRRAPAGGSADAGRRAATEVAVACVEAAIAADDAPREIAVRGGLTAFAKPWHPKAGDLRPEFYFWRGSRSVDNAWCTRSMPVSEAINEWELQDREHMVPCDHPPAAEIVSRETPAPGTEEKASPEKPKIEQGEVFRVGTGESLGIHQFVRLNPGEWRPAPHIAWCPGWDRFFRFEVPGWVREATPYRFYRIATEEDLLP
jgi:hypothetical protein